MGSRAFKCLLVGIAITLLIISLVYSLPISPLKINHAEAAYNFYGFSNASTTIVDNPVQRHAFQPVHTDTIVELNKPIHGNTWKYFAYDSDVEGTQIRLYYSNDTAGTWTQYPTPILGPKANFYRWPSTTIVNGTFNMFLEDRTGGTLERWTSTDGVTYKFQESIKSGGNEYKNPFIWLNPNDGRWYLYSHDAVGTGLQESLKVRSAPSLDSLKAANDVTILTRNQLFGSPTVMFYKGVYWLLGEVISASRWQTVAFYSTSSPTSGFTEASNSPILPNDESCPMLFLTKDKNRAYLYSISVTGTWYACTREVYINSQAPTPTTSPTVTANPPPTSTPTPPATSTPSPTPTLTPTLSPTPMPTPTPTPTATPAPESISGTELPSFTNRPDSVYAPRYLPPKSSPTQPASANPSPTPTPALTTAQTATPTPKPASSPLPLKATAEFSDAVPIALAIAASSVASMLILWKKNQRLKAKH